jgi:HTH-type transcriptional regulator / antitoxin HigA
MINTTIKPIRTEQDYEAALLRIESLMIAEANTPEADELEVLATLVELYEEKHYQIGWPGPIGAMALTVPMMQALNEHLGIPAEMLLKQSTT